MIISQAYLLTIFLFQIFSLEMSETKIAAITPKNFFIPPFVEKIRNYRSKDYLIKLLKRNLEEKLRKTRKLDDNKIELNEKNEEKFEKSKCNCNCKCNEHNFNKRCNTCEDSCEGCHKQKPPFKNFVCESEGSFANPNSCQQFYICFHNDLEPIAVTCPRGFAFDSIQGKCTRKAARECMKKKKPDGNLQKLKRFY